MRDPFVFFEVFGKIDDDLVEASFQKWQEEKRFSFTGYQRKIACVILILVIAGGCIFHTEVQAALQKVVTLISEMLGIEEDLSSFTDVKRISVTQKGLMLTLEEVVLDKDQLLMLVSRQFEAGKEEIDAELSGVVKMNGTRLDISKNYITDATLDAPAHKYVFGYYLDMDIKPEELQEIEAVFTVKNAADESEIGEYQFRFSTSCSELEKNTTRISMDEKIAVSESVTLNISAFTLNPVESNILGACENLPLGVEYYLKGQDNCGNKVVYRLLSYEDSKVIFVKEEDCHISPNAGRIELQLYRHSLGELNGVFEEGDMVVRDYIDEDVSKMEPVGEAFKINMKHKTNKKKEVKDKGSYNK